MVHEHTFYSLTCDKCHTSLGGGTFYNKEDMRHHALARDWHTRLKQGYDFGEYNYYCPECSKELGLN